MDGSRQTVDSIDDLVGIVGSPIQRVAEKVLPSLHPVAQAWIEHSPLMFLATSDADGRCDVSPKGDPAGFVRVLDQHTIVVPDRPGNRRVDGYRNLLLNPQAGLIFLIPGRGDTLRVNGRATILRDAEFFGDLAVKGKRPELALLIDVEEAFFHCSKAFLRSQAWDAESWQPDAAPSRAEIAKTLERPDEPIEELQRYYGPAYAENLY